MEWRLTTLGAGRAWPPPTQTPQSSLHHREYKLPHTDSGQNSLEYWDYTVELEMLKGPEDLQLAAELGKTLLERNRELEVTLKQQQAVIDDQLQEIEYLSKQTAALREVNDSRLRIYEQLEVSIQDLEKNNQRLAAEGAADKKKIKSLSSNTDALELRCDELQRNLDEVRLKLQQQHQQQQQQQQQQRGRNKRRSLILDEQNVRRSQSCESSTQQVSAEESEDDEVRKCLEELQDKLKTTQQQLAAEVRRKEEIEIQLACTTQENSVLMEQLAVLREKEMTVRTLDDEISSLDDTSSGRICRKCLGNVGVDDYDSESNPTLYDDLHDSIEDTDASIESIHGECALVKLKNGGYAWGSQESLASIGQVVNSVGSTSPGMTETSEAPHNSLLSELDTSYRILIEKYEALLEARGQQQQQHHGDMIHSGVDDVSGPMSLIVTTNTADSTTITTSSRCHRCNVCVCDLKPSVIAPSHSKGNNMMEEFSEVETSSSGFSDGESRFISKGTQTGGEEALQHHVSDAFLEDLTPTVNVKCLDLTSPINPCEKRFQATPEYKKLFQEIFTVLKQSVDEKDTQTDTQTPSKPMKTPQSQDDAAVGEVFSVNPVPSNNEHMSFNHSSTTKDGNNAVKSPPTQGIQGKKTDSNEVEESVMSPTSTGNVIEDIFSSSGDAKVMVTTNTSAETLHHKPRPLRPDSLDLGGDGGGSSRPSSRQRRRKRRQQLLIHQQDPQHQQQQSTDYNLNLQEESHHSRHSHHRRDKNGLHHTQRNSDNYNHYRQDATEGVNAANADTRVVYNSNSGGGGGNRCKHHRSSRKHRRSQQENTEQHRHHHHHQQQQQQQSEGIDCTSKATKITYPSVEVARLRRLEMTYAEVLKNSMNRSYYRKY